MSNVATDLLETPHEVVRCLTTYNDWWQPATGSVMKFSSIRRKDHGDGLHPGVTETIDQRTELNRRMRTLPDRDRRLLFLWYVKQLHVDDIAAATGISRRQCFRRRSRAIQQLAEGGRRRPGS